MRQAPLLALATLLVAGCVDLPGTSDATAPPVLYEGLEIATELGTLRAILFCGETPLTCEFMRELVDARYYDGRAFGRIIPGFVIQEVDRTGGTTDHEGTVPAEFGTTVMFSAGALGIARNADPNSGGSEFFVMDFATSHLYGNFTAFAQVVEGLDVVHAIARVPAARTGPASAVVGSPAQSPIVFGVHDRVPVDPVQMTKVTWTTIELPAREAARYPLVVAESTRTDAYRATFESPRDLAAGAPSDVTWYVMPRDASPSGSVKDPDPVDLAGAHALVDGPAPADITLTEDAVRGILRGAWTPGAAGAYQVRLMRGDEELALANVTVPG